VGSEYYEHVWLLQEYRGLRPGMHVVYQNPAWQQPDGSYKTAGMDPPLVITEIVDLGDGYVTAVINDGEWEVNAANLAPEKSEGEEVTGR
jgi:hypothetical protein